MEEITIRSATQKDFNILLDWRNDAVTRANSQNANLVSREEHAEWLNSTLQDPARKLFIAEMNDRPIGTVRADYAEESVELSWTVAPAARGTGLGKKMVGAVSKQIQHPQRAKVKKDNFASIRIAEHIGMKLDYEQEGILYFSK